MPRAGLSETKVVEAAEQLADEVGLSALTLTALATRLGIRQPSLYKHISSLADLHRLMSIRAKSELAVVFARACAGRSRGDALHALSKAYRAWATEHPGRYAGAQRAPRPGDLDDEAASNAVVRVFLDVLAGFDLAGDDAIDATRALRSTLHGFVTLEAVGGFGLPVDIDRSFDRLISGMELSTANWIETAMTP